MSHEYLWTLGAFVWFFGLLAWGWWEDVQFYKSGKAPDSHL